jgi:hypothetical protein
VQDVELGVRVRIRDHDTSADLGVAALPAPVRVGDLDALEQGEPLRITHVIEPLPGATATPVFACPDRALEVAR